MASKNEEVIEELTRKRNELAKRRLSSKQDLQQLKEEFDLYDQLLKTQGATVGKQFRRLSQHITSEMEQYEKITKGAAEEEKK